MGLDDEILREATEARDRLVSLQHDVDGARGEYHHAIRRLHAAGGSMREIAEALGLSHQRVHQIVDETQPAPRRARLPRPRLRRQTGGFWPFTDRAREVMERAQEEARSLGHRYVGTEHVLLALFGVKEGVAARALQALGVEAASARAAVRELVGEGKGSPPGPLPFKTGTKRTLEHAVHEAVGFGHHQVGTEHLLLALTSRDEGTAAEVLRRLGLDDDHVRAEIGRLLAA